MKKINHRITRIRKDSDGSHDRISKYNIIIYLWMENNSIHNKLRLNMAVVENFAVNIIPCTVLL